VNRSAGRKPLADAELPALRRDPDPEALAVNAVGRDELYLIPVGDDLRVAAARVGDSVQIAVQDNGPGIAAEVAGRLFEPFVTSKPVGQGTGLGLALCREYVLSFGGQLALEPIVGAGARFSILLPMTPIGS